MGPSLCHGPQQILGFTDVYGNLNISAQDSPSSVKQNRIPRPYSVYKYIKMSKFLFIKLKN